MPAVLLPYREAVLGRGGSGPAPELRGQLSKALSDAERDDARRIRALLSWYTSGRGQWSYYPSYESLPEMLLLAEAPQVLRAVLLRTTSPPQNLQAPHAWWPAGPRGTCPSSAICQLRHGTGWPLRSPRTAMRTSAAGSPAGGRSQNAASGIRAAPID